MPQEQQFKRNTAYKLRVGDVLVGKPVTNGDKFNFLELGNKKVVRVNLIGNIVDKYESDGERKYLFFTIDDGSGQIKAKAFTDDVPRFKEFYQGQTILLVGTLRFWNNELYISPEIIREQNPRYLLLRKLETEKDRMQNTNTPVEKEQVMAIKDRILDLIRGAEDRGGIELTEVTGKFTNFSPSVINQEIQRLLEEGIIFEPRPGKVRYLG